MNMLLDSCMKAGLANIASQRTMARHEICRANEKENAELRRVGIIASKEDFFLRAVPKGYDFGKDPDPSGVWPSKYPK